VDQYDYIFIDCPPSLSILTINALVFATSVLIPLQCEFFALEGLTHLLKTVNLIKKKLNPELEIEGVLLTMYDRRYNLTAQVEEDVRGHLGKMVLNTVIPRNVRISEAPSHGKPAIIYDLKCIGSMAYIALAKEILEKQGM
jgi:chromosome partitioning protein